MVVLVCRSRHYEGYLFVFVGQRILPGLFRLVRSKGQREGQGSLDYYTYRTMCMRQYLVDI